MTTLNADRRLPLYKYHGRTAQDWFDSYRHEMIEAIEAARKANEQESLALKAKRKLAETQRELEEAQRKLAEAERTDFGTLADVSGCQRSQPISARMSSACFTVSGTL